MNIGKHFLIAACTVFFICSSTASAQEADNGMSVHTERHYNPVSLSSEQLAQHATDRMDSLLNLTDKQYGKLYKLNLKWAREDIEKMAPVPRMDGRPEGAPAFGGAGGFGQGPRGNRSPSDMANRHPPRDFPSSDDRKDMEKQREKMEKLLKKREKKLKKILTDEQYAIWIENQHPDMPEDRRTVK